jgi:subtilisin family serine protease
MSFRKFLFFVTILTLLLSSSAFAGSLSDIPDKPAIPKLLGYVPNKIVVKFGPGLFSGISKALFHSGKTGLPVLDAIGAKHGAKFIKPEFPGAQKRMLHGRVIDLSGWHEIHFAGRVPVEDIVKEYKSIPGVIDAQPVSIHPVYATLNDQFYNSQWHLPKIQAAQAWDIETGNSSIIVAILDTGVRYFMQDLGGSGTSYADPTGTDGNMWINLAEKEGTPGLDNDNNGFVNDWIGWDFVESTDGDPLSFLIACSQGEDCDTADNDPRDFNGHGTHCAGSVAAMSNNGYAVASVSGGWGDGTFETAGNGVKVMPLRIGWSASFLGILELGVVDMSYAAQAFVYAADNGARIASCSWGSENTGGIQDAIDYFLASGGLIFIAAGNDGLDNPDYISSLSGGLYERIIKVAATDQNDCRASFSNYGNWVTLSAPGVGIWSTYHLHSDPVNDYVAPMDGTSMAAPLAASVAALIWSHNPDLTADEVKDRLLSSADSIDGLSCNSAYAGEIGAGRINAYRAVSSTEPPPAPANAGTLQFSAATSSIGESGGSILTTVTRTGGSSGPVGVSYATANGTATAGSDYTSMSGTLSWADGDTASKTFSIFITDDSLNELDETFTVTLSSPTGGATLGSPSSATVTIVDDDPMPTVQFSAASSSGSEATTPALIAVMLSAASGQTVTVKYATTDGTATAGSDYTSTSGTLTFNPGVTTQAISVPVLNDTVAESDETFTVTLSVPVNATLGALTAHSYTILDKVPQVGVKSVITGKFIMEGKGRNKTTSFVGATTFQQGDGVVIRTEIGSSDGDPVGGATVTIMISGPENHTLAGVTDGTGHVEVTWQTTKPNKRGIGGTTTGTYTAKIANVFASGYAWDGIPQSKGFTVSPN